MPLDFQILPNYRFPAPSLSVVDRDVLNRQADANETQLQVCALNEPLRFGYGLNRVGALTLRPVQSGNNLLLPFIVSRGEIDAIVSIEFDGVPITTHAPGTYQGYPIQAIASHTYLGTTPQSIDSWLATEWSGRRQVYADTLDGIAWAVLKIPPGNPVGGNLTILARMLKCAQTDGGAKVYTENPVYWLADFITSTAYGKGEPIDWDTVADVAAINDELVGGVARRKGGLMIDTVRSLDDIEETLRAYAGCWVVREGGVVRLVPDAPAASVFAFTNAAGSANYKSGTVKGWKPKVKDTPTVVTVMWTDTSSAPW
ncbi:MAG: hypothetical protein ACREBE_24015, partial [bacterium]